MVELGEAHQSARRDMRHRLNPRRRNATAALTMSWWLIAGGELI